MNLPHIDLSSIPGLDTVVGIFGSITNISTPGHDDSVVIVATFVYDTSGLIG